MKLTIASLLVGSAAAFAPTAPISGRNSALNMVAAGTATEGAKVRQTRNSKTILHNDETIQYRTDR
jgi:hypothetical protein